MESQAIALAEKVGIPFIVKRVFPKRPWIWLPPGLWPAPLAALSDESDTIMSPWPDLIISCGRRAVPYALLAKARSNGTVTTVHIQNPNTRFTAFDFIVLPQHDHLKGPNVIETEAALHCITNQRLKEAADQLESSLSHLPRPLVAVLIGGSNACYRLTPQKIISLAEQLKNLCENQGVGLLVTPSRRTGEKNIGILRRSLEGLPAEVWDCQGKNPYFGYLGLADSIIVTCDSVNMVTEACATNKPVHVVHLEGGNRKFNEFHYNMRAAGYTRTFKGRLEDWNYHFPDDTTNVAKRIHELLGKKGVPHQLDLKIEDRNYT